MNISSLTDTSALAQLINTKSTSGASELSSLLSSNSTNSTSSDSASLSDPGKLFAELKTLSQSNPTEFKKIAAEIAKELQAAASNSSDPSQSSALSEMASNFSKASQSGKFSDLFPQQTQQSGTSQGHGNASAPPKNDDTLSQIFSNALAQIQSDLSSSATATTSTSTGTSS